MEIIDYIKKISRDVAENIEGVTAYVGYVESTQPWSIRITPKIVLGREFLLFMKNSLDYETEEELVFREDLRHRHIIKGIEPGDEVLLIRAINSDKFIVTGKIGGGSSG